MKVALMGRSLRGEFSGVVRYTDELVRALAPRLDGNLWVFVTRAHDGLDGVCAQRVRAPFPTPNEYARAIWEQAIVPWNVRRLGPDVYHSPNYILPLAVSCPTVVTVHDLAFLDRSLHRARSHVYLSWLTAIAVRKASRVICVSDYTRDQLALHFPGVVEKIRVVGEGLGERFAPQSAESIGSFRRTLGFDEPYVLFVGTVEPRKNLARLIRAFDRAIAESGSPHHLVIAGAAGWLDSPVRAAHSVARLPDRVHFLGYLAESELPAAYSGADLFAYPSLAEGFGLPPLEAMGCGTAVLTSNVSALPEVVGDAALTVDPLDEDALALALARLLTDPAAREAMAAAGLRRSRDFRWDRVAEQVLGVYREAAA
jgi:glycosyltransferase involved in cell wall biosynthesis